MVTFSNDCPARDVSIRDGKGLVHVKDLTDAKGLYQHGRMFAHVTIQPGCSIGDHPHVHETEFYYILQGEGVFNDNGKTRIVHAGDICATGFGEVHGIENQSSEALEMIALIVSE